MNNKSLEFWQQIELKGNIGWKKWTMIVNLVHAYDPDIKLDYIANLINADWTEYYKHDKWLKESTAITISDWVLHCFINDKSPDKTQQS